MKPSTLQKKIMEFNRSAASLGDLARLLVKRRNVTSIFQRLGNNLAQDIVQREIAASRYFEMVEEVEAPFYTKNNGCVELQEELLLRRYQERRGSVKDANRADPLHPLDFPGGSCEVSEVPF
jgi:hypothetical protein